MKPNDINDTYGVGRDNSLMGTTEIHAAVTNAKPTTGLVESRFPTKSPA